MKITKIETFLVNLGHRNIPFVKVHTDEGTLRHRRGILGWAG